MAPAAQPRAKRATYDGSRPRFQSLQAWLNVYGNAEYAIYKRDAAPNPMSYEDWSASELVLGPFLWYTTLDIWEESSSDEESDLETPAITSHVPPERQPKKTVPTNGHGKRGAAKSSTSAAPSRPEDAAASGKRRRKPKKPYLSEDIVVSDVSDQVDESVPAVDTGPPIATDSTNPANGRRKSGGRKKKQYLSAETISPEDEDDDPMAMDGVAAAASYAHEPSAPAEHHIPVAAVSHPPKGKPGRKPKKKSLPAISRDDDGHVDAPVEAATTPKNAAASPEGPGSSSSRRGLRTRTPAQQRPYFHHAQVFDELVSGGLEKEPSPKPSPPKVKTNLKLTAPQQEEVGKLASEMITEQDELQWHEEHGIEHELSPDEDEDESMLEPEEPRPPRKVHYKGKGRAWKKISEDEDEDYKSPVKIKGSNQPTRKLGRRRPNQASQSLGPGPETEELERRRQDEQNDEESTPVTYRPIQTAGKRGRKPRRGHLSEEFVRDDSDTEMEEQKTPEQEKLPATEPVEGTPKGKGQDRSERPYQDSTSKVSINIDADDEISKAKSPAKKSTPKKSSEVISLANSVNGNSDVEVIPSDKEPVPDLGESAVPVSPSPTAT